jgi:oligopeptide/dipeptide ABC transporter ATP-binding protein
MYQLTPMKFIPLPNSEMNIAAKKNRNARCPSSSDQSTRCVVAVAIELHILLSKFISQLAAAIPLRELKTVSGLWNAAAFFREPRQPSPYDNDMAALLELRSLTVELPTAAGWVKPVNEVSLQIAAGETLGLVGESGSGKTMLSLALMGLLPAGARIAGEARLTLQNGNAKSLPALSEEQWRAVRGREIAMIFQEPMTSLNPVMRVGAQIEEAILAHESKLSREELRRSLLTAMQHAAMPEPDIRAQQYPHQLSGGLRQRAMIAMALAPSPKLLIADEPTTALDVTVQKQILDLLDRLRRELQLALLFITHDLAVVANVADRVAVMYAGRIVEEGPVQQVLTAPLHPYTQGLLNASPTLEPRTLTPIPGTVPRLTELPAGCAFAPRCSYRRTECDQRVPDFRFAGSTHGARCVLV